MKKTTGFLLPSALTEIHFYGIFGKNWKTGWILPSALFSMKRKKYFTKERSAKQLRSDIINALARVYCYC